MTFDDGSLRVEPDHARERYERLRDLYLHGSSGDDGGPTGERLARFGFVGLFDPDPPRAYVAEIYEARARGWGRVDAGDAALRDAVRLLLGSGALVIPSRRSTAEERRMGR